MVPKIEASGLDDYTRNMGYKTGSITYEFEIKAFHYDRGIRLLAYVKDVDGAPSTASWLGRGNIEAPLLSDFMSSGDAVEFGNVYLGDSYVQK